MFLDVNYAIITVVKLVDISDIRDFFTNNVNYNLTIKTQTYFNQIYIIYNLKNQGIKFNFFFLDRFESHKTCV